MQTMRAIGMTEVGGPDVLELVDAPMPVRANAEVLVKVLAAGVNPIDAKTRAGRGVSGAIRHYPAILGYDLCGEVVESPYQSHPLQPGRRVYGMTMVPRIDGTYAEYAVVPEAFLAPAPTTLSAVEAAAVPLAALTAWGMVVEVAKAHDGQRMLIHAGAGGVGHFAVQLAAYFGARVIATASQRNVGWLHELGASRVIDYGAERFEDVIDEVDVVIDLIGNVHDETGSRSLRVLRPGGLLVNAPTGSWPTMEEEAAAAGVRATGFRVAPSGSTLGVISRLIDAGDLRVNVERTYPLAEAAEAHRVLERGHVRGKLVLTVAE